MTDYGEWCRINDGFCANVCGNRFLRVLIKDDIFLFWFGCKFCSYLFWPIKCLKEITQMRRKGLMILVIAAMICLKTSYANAEIYQYDELNRVIKVIYENGSYVEYQYDSNGNIVNTKVYIADGSEVTQTPEVTVTPEATATPSVTKAPTPTTVPTLPSVTPTAKPTVAPGITETPEVTKVPGITVTPTTVPTMPPKVSSTVIPDVTKTPTPRVTMTPRPEATKKPTQAVRPTVAPGVTKTPAPEVPRVTVTPTPRITEKPSVTVKPTPEVTKRPEVPSITATPTPLITESPSVPDITDEPEVTKVPDKTDEIERDLVERIVQRTLMQHKQVVSKMFKQVLKLFDIRSKY